MHMPSLISLQYKWLEAGSGQLLLATTVKMVGFFEFEGVLKTTGIGEFL